MTTEQTDSKEISAIDLALARLEARKAAKAAGKDPKVAADAVKPTKAPKVKVETDRAAERAAKDAERLAAKVQRDEERAAKKALAEAANISKIQDREAAKAAKLAEREAAKAAKQAAKQKPAHTSKVDKARAKLPTLSKEAAEVAEMSQTLSVPELEALSLHIAFEARQRSTIQSAGRELAVGDTVRIVAGPYVGQVGTVAKVQSIRTYVSLPNGKDAYCFKAAVERVSAEAIEA